MCKRGDTVRVSVISNMDDGETELRDVDKCLVPLIVALNGYGIATEGCCCGHGEVTGHITLTDGRILGIYPNRKIYLAINPGKLS